MKTLTISRHPFHIRAVNWLRDRMGVDTETLPTNVMADEHDPAKALVQGRVLAGGHPDTFGYLALIMLMVAACAVMATARPGLPAGFELGLQILAGVTTVAATAILAVDAWRVSRRRRSIEVVVLARDTEPARVEPEQLEQWCAVANGDLWIVSEAGFAPEALALARRRSVRCFAKGTAAMEEVTGH